MIDKPWRFCSERKQKSATTTISPNSLPFFIHPPILRGGRACYTTATNIAIFSKKMSVPKQNNHF